LFSKNSSNGGGWKIFSKENVGNVSYVLKQKQKAPPRPPPPKLQVEEYINQSPNQGTW
jgi:hypothetical protein